MWHWKVKTSESPTLNWFHLAESFSQANRCSANQGIFHPSWNTKFTTVFARARHWSHESMLLPHPTLHQVAHWRHFARACEMVSPVLYSRKVNNLEVFSVLKVVIVVFWLRTTWTVKRNRLYGLITQNTAVQITEGLWKQGNSSVRDTCTLWTEGKNGNVAALTDYFISV